MRGDAHGTQRLAEPETLEHPAPRWSRAPAPRPLRAERRPAHRPRPRNRPDASASAAVSPPIPAPTMRMRMTCSCHGYRGAHGWPRSTEKSAQTGGARSGIPARRSRWLRAPDASLAEVVAAYRASRACQAEEPGWQRPKIESKERLEARRRVLKPVPGRWSETRVGC